MMRFFLGGDGGEMKKKDRLSSRVSLNGNPKAPASRSLIPIKLKSGNFIEGYHRLESYRLINMRATAGT